MNIINKNAFTYFKDQITGWFYSKEKPKLKEKDNKIIEKERNKQIGNNDNNDDLIFENDNDQTIIKKEQNNYINNNKIDDEDAILDEALAETKGTRKGLKQFSNAVKDSMDVVDVTNKNMDISLNNVNNVNQKMKKYK